jgi:hypothetical protein
MQTKNSVGRQEGKTSLGTAVRKWKDGIIKCGVER